MRLPNRLALSIVLTLLLPLALVVGLYFVEERNVEAQGIERLNEVTTARTAELDAVVRDYVHQIEGFARSDAMRSRARDYAMDVPGARAALRKRLDLIAAAGRTSLDVRVVMVGGDIITSETHRNDALIPANHLLERARERSSFGTPRIWENRDFVLSMATPIYDGQEFLGTLAVTFKATILRRVIENREGLGRTGEVLLVDRLPDGRYYVISPSRIGGPAKGELIMIKPSRPAARAFEGHTEAVITEDRRGRLVAAATDRIEAVGWGVVTKMELSEVMEPAWSIGRVVLILGLLSMFIGLVLAVTLRREVGSQLARLEAAPAPQPPAMARLSEGAEADDSAPYESQKMEALGRLAGGVAHDFNNLLTVILGYADVLGKTLEHDETGRSYVRELRTAAERAAALTRKLLAFGQREVVAPLVLDLGAVVRELEPLLRRSLGPESTLSLDITSEATTIHADSGHLEQILLNLALNSRDAMPGGGEVVIEVVRAPMPNGEDGVLLRFQDNGIGMDEATSSRAVEPFFTTKEESHAVGLGLAMVYGAVRQSKGVLSIESTLGSGTVVGAHFPFVPLEARAETTPSLPPPASERPRRILLAEDEPAVRRLITEVLESAGYEVLGAEDGEQALALAEQNERIDLVLTDVVMPRLGGEELALALEELRPELPVLFMSGYTRSPSLKARVAKRESAFLSKPVRAGVLLEKLSEMFSGDEERRDDPARG